MVKQNIDSISSSEYASLLKNVKKRILIAQQHAYYSANAELLRMYWDVGEMLFTSKTNDGWGKKTLQRLANDLKNEYTDIKGFSIRNMQCMMQFYNEYNKELTMCKMSASAIAQPSVAQLSQEINVDVQPITQPSVAQLTNSNFSLPITHVSWSNNLVLMQKVKDIKARYWYMIQCISANWTRDYLKEPLNLIITNNMVLWQTTFS